MRKKYGKSSEGLLAIKKSFFTDNDRHLQRQDRISAAYLRQPKRTRCKNCAQPVEGVDFESHRVPYRLCEACHHLNGMHEETEKFFYEIYHRDAGVSYGATYSDQVSKDDYDFRVQEIYRPKAVFLRECLEAAGRGGTEHVTVSDFGAGAGFFVAGLRQEGFDARGLEVSVAQVGVGNRMLGAELLEAFDPAQTTAILARNDCQVLCLIGVLEHVPSPRDALRAIKANPNIEYVYLSVPLFSPAVCFELLFPESFNRHLGGAHTHLYSVRSIEHFCGEFGFRIQAQWLFGTDIMDLYRHCLTTARLRGASDAAIAAFDNMLMPIIDPLQLCLDQSEGSSEGHFLLAKA
jgi:2-polyprenyl-3-methyl-5-hydroxy-6-metoxy-1,4-benzoquinol methylase